MIASARAPYMRAGLAWATRDPLRPDIRELDGSRLLELLGDPVLTVSIGREDGSFKPFPALDETVTVDLLQGMIDDLAAELPPIGGDAPAVSPLEQQLLDAQDSGMRLASALEAAKEREAVILGQLQAASFTSVEELISALSAERSTWPYELTIGKFTASFDNVRELMGGFEAIARAIHVAGFTSIDQLVSAHSSAVSQLGTAKETINALTNERDGATSRVIELEREVAQLKAAASAKAPKPRPAGTDKPS